VTVIFKDLDIESLIQKIRDNAVLNKAIKFIKSNRIFVKFTSICMASIFAIVISVVSVGITVGFNVKYSGKVIATVNDTAVFESARDIAARSVESDVAEKAISAPKFTLTLTVTDKLANAVKLADAIIKNTEEFVEGSSLVINGEDVVCTEAEGLEDLIEERRTAFYVEGAENTASFIDTVETKQSYYLKSDIEDLESVKEIIDTLQVKTVSTITADKAIAYSTKKVYTTAKAKGYTEVTSAGVNGVKRETVMIESLNDEVCSETKISEEVITEPVQQVITVGTGTVRATAKNSTGFIFPISKGKYRISSYFGDGRNHKGIDICADKGVSIYAVASGTVEFSGFDGTFGYTIIINHGNGVKTRYAHSSALYVNKGDTVSQGDIIAAVGSTGNSTGNHLHFEVIVNGTRVNPAPYIGL